MESSNTSATTDMASSASFRAEEEAKLEDSPAIHEKGFPSYRSRGGTLRSPLKHSVEHAVGHQLGT